MNYRIVSLFLLFIFAANYNNAQGTQQGLNNEEDNALVVPVKDFTLSMNEKGMVIKAPDLEGKALLTIAQEEKELVFEDGIAFFPYSTNGKGELVLFKTTEGKYTLFHISKSKNGEFRLRSIPLWLSILPPLIAILFALLFKEVIVSLFTGILAGSFIAGGLRIDSFYYFFLSFFEVVQKYVLHALDDTGHLSVIIFSLLIGGMVAIISRNGGMAGVVASLSRYARSPRSSQFITWLLGVAIFFDDYANTLIVGNTMRSVTDKFRISREKLAYIVDSTAAPVVAIAFITTWIGAELGYIADGMKLLDGFDKDMTPYAIFISSLKYSFYPVLTLIFILILIYTKRDYGEMYTAEMRARTTGKVSAATKGIDDEPDMEDLSPVKGAPLKWYNAAIPVLVVIFGTIFGLWDTGIDNTYSELVKKGIPVNSESWGDVWAGMSGLLNDNQSGFFIKIGKLIGNSDSFIALLWASVAGVTIAIFMTVFGRIMKVSDTMHALTTGFKTMMPAIIILTLAWSLAITTEELYTANFLTSILKDSLNPYAVPVLVFILAALISFSTGSSWSTMAILYPIAIPTTWAVCMSQGMDSDISLEILLNVIAVVLAASVLGDHCSPISDTTILSSLASDCNHIDHVRTQLPYALTVGSVSLIAGGLSTLLGGGWFISSILLLISIAVLALVIWKFGKKVE